MFDFSFLSYDVNLLRSCLFITDGILCTFHFLLSPSLLTDLIGYRPPLRCCSDYIWTTPRLEHIAGLVALPCCPSRDIHRRSFQCGVLSTCVRTEYGQTWW
jgi:hypothetical protein